MPKVNWQDSLANSLELCIIPAFAGEQHGDSGSRMWRDAVRQKMLPRVETTWPVNYRPAETKYGPAVGIGWNDGENQTRIQDTTTRYTYNQWFSLLWVARYEDDGTSPDYSVLNSSVGGIGVGSGEYVQLNFRGGGTIISQSVFSDGLEFVLAVSMDYRDFTDSPGSYGFINGEPLVWGTRSGNSYPLANDDLQILNAGRMVLAAAWPRALTVREMNRLTVDPWCFLRPPPVHIWGAVAGSGGGVGITPGPGALEGGGIDPTVGMGSVNITLVAGALIGGGADPAAILGPIAVSPGTGSFAGDGLDPAVLLGGVTVIPAVGTHTGGGVDPTVEMGNSTATPLAGALAGGGVDPTVDMGSGVEVTPDPGVFSGGGEDPAVALGSITLNPTAGTLIGDGSDPTVVMGSLTIVGLEASGGGYIMSEGILQGTLTTDAIDAGSAAQVRKWFINYSTHAYERVTINDLADIEINSGEARVRTIDGREATPWRPGVDWGTTIDDDVTLETPNMTVSGPVGVIGQNYRIKVEVRFSSDGSSWTNYVSWQNGASYSARYIQVKITLSRLNYNWQVSLENLAVHVAEAA